MFLTLKEVSGEKFGTKYKKIVFFLNTICTEWSIKLDLLLFTEAFLLF